MKTMTPHSAVTPKHSEGETKVLGHSDVHCYPSDAGKFNFGFMERGTEETEVETPIHATGAYPVTEGTTSKDTKPTHAPGTLV